MSRAAERVARVLEPAELEGRVEGVLEAVYAAFGTARAAGLTEDEAVRSFLLEQAP